MLDGFTLRNRFSSRTKLIKTIFFFLVLSLSLEAEITWGSEISTKELDNHLFKAVAENNLALVRSSITAGANTKAINAEGLTAAGLAIERGYFNIAHYILSIMNQKPEGNETKTGVQLKKETTNYRPSTRSSLEIEESSNALSTKDRGSRQILPKKHILQWPQNKPNPFSPNTRPKSLPIIGSLQKSPVRSVVPQETISLDIKVQKSKLSPLKTLNNTATREMQAPTPILPLNKEAEKQIPEQEKGFFTNLEDLLKSNKLKQSSTTTNKTAPKSIREEHGKGGFIDNIWQKITSSF